MIDRFYKRCPICNFATGFDLDHRSILRNEEYLCTYCGNDSKLTSYKKCKENEYNEEVLAIKLLLKNKVKLQLIE